MFEYKSEIIKTKTKWVSMKADENDVLALDALINERSSDGWELVTYSYMSTDAQLKGATLITFRREK